MSEYSSFEEFQNNNPLYKYSVYADGRVQILRNLSREILEELDKAFPENHINFPKQQITISSHLGRAEELSWLWVLGAYEVIRTMDEAKECFSDRACKSIKELKNELSQIRMPMAKMEERKIKGVPKTSINSTGSPAGIDRANRDLLVGAPYDPKSLRKLLEHFYAFVSQLDGNDILKSFG
jgi:hypothetical protein